MSLLEHPPSEPTLYTCHVGPRFGSVKHPCGKAHDALDEAGIAHRTHVFGTGRPFGIATGGRRPELKQISGQEKLPVLALPDGTTVSGSGAIVHWARAQSST
jgi:hypothetical protein